MSPFECAIERFDQENGRDPNLEQVDGREVPHELLYSDRLTDWVLRLDANASEALRLAARCQHIRRWEIPRSAYPEGRAGYHQWKNRLKAFHAEVSGTILRECGLPEELIHRVQQLNLKANFPADPEARTLEDALCLVFLQYQFVPLAAKAEAEKVVNALRKSWAKMTPKAREFALQLELGKREQSLLTLALSSPVGEAPKPL